MDRKMLLAVGVLAALGCAAAADPAPSVGAIPPLEERMAQNPEWKPGDPEPTWLDVDRFAATTDPNASTQPLHWITVVRNRCDQSMSFSVGPKNGPTDGDPPTYEVPPRSAVCVGAHEHDWFFLRLPGDDAWHRAQAVSGHIIIEGEHCDEVVLVQRDD